MQAEVSLNSAIPSVTIIIPAYNEEKRIGKVLKDIADHISKNNLNWNIIVSIDGNDGTEQIVKNMAKNYNFISYDKSKVRGGKGWAIKRVVNRAEGKFTILMDADGSISFYDVIKYLKFTGEYDVILFDRYHSKNSRIPFLRKIPSRGYNILVRALFRIKVYDTQCGYQIIRTELLKKAFNKITVTNGFYYVPLIYYLKHQGAKIIELNDITYRHNGESKFDILAMMVGGGVSLIAFRLRHSRFYKYVPHWARELYSRKFKWI